jgi:hypothetical protein
MLARQTFSPLEALCQPYYTLLLLKVVRWKWQIGIQHLFQCLSRVPSSTVEARKLKTLFPYVPLHQQFRNQDPPI